MTAMFKTWHFWIVVLILVVVAYYIFWNMGFDAGLNEPAPPPIK